MKKIVIVQRRLTHYRVPLFDLMRERLLDKGVVLELLVGKPKKSEEAKNDGGYLSWAKIIPTQYLFNERLCWQPVYKYIGSAQLVVVTQENSLLINHLLMISPKTYKLAFWGHGANLQSSNPDSLRERFKRWTTTKVDWWFAYTNLSADLVVRCGFPRELVTVLDNAIDTNELAQYRDSIGKGETDRLLKNLGIEGSRVGIFVGSLYSDKRIPFLLEAGKRIKEHIPDFVLLIIGDGPQREMVEEWSKENPWCRWVGALKGREKVKYLSTAEVMLNPGLIGLGILDSFVCRIPVITTDCGLHSPEISYLEDGVNGLIVEDHIDTFVDACVDLLENKSQMINLRDGCAKSSKKYTVERMAEKFVDGIERALS